MLRGKKEVTYGDIDTFISQQVEIKGEIHSKGSIRIDGNMEGAVNAEGDVVIGEKGMVKGEVKAKNIIIAGSVEGNVTAAGRLEVSPTGKVNGDVSCDILVVEEGAILNGMAKMKKAETGKEKKEEGNRKK